MNMHKAVWATCRWHVWLVLRHKQLHNVFFPLCSSEEQGRELEKKRTLQGTSSFPQQGWITSTLMKQTRIQRSTKPMRADNASVHPQDTPTPRTIHLTELYANSVSLQSFSTLKHNALISDVNIYADVTDTMHHKDFNIQWRLAALCSGTPSQKLLVLVKCVKSCKNTI